LNTSNNLAFCSVFSSEDIITGSLDSCSRKEYSRLGGKVFNSKVGGSSMDGFMLGVEVLSSSSKNPLLLLSSTYSSCSSDSFSLFLNCSWYTALPSIGSLEERF